MVTVQTLIQFLVNGDLLGFIQAIYVSAFGSADLFWAFIVMLFTTPLYIRTKSLALLSIIWLLLGPLVIVAVPIVSGLSIFLMLFGISGLLLSVYLRARG